MVFDPKYNDRIIEANASMLRHGAKISFLSMFSLTVAFASGTSITGAARKAKVHRDTVRDIFAALRDRLSKPRFKKWVQSAYTSLHLGDEDDAAQMAEAREVLFQCHENTECQKRYSAGRRKARVCRTCPINDYVQSHGAYPEYTEALIELVDNLREFYQLLGWKECVNSGTDNRDVFDKRFRHYEIYSTAVSHSTFDDDGKVTSTDDEFLSILHLAKELMADLREEPLK